MGKGPPLFESEFSMFNPIRKITILILEGMKKNDLKFVFFVGPESSLLRGGAGEDDDSGSVRRCGSELQVPGCKCDR